MARPRAQRPFAHLAHLALLAMLALALLPSAGRIAGALRGDGAIEPLGLAALCSPSRLGADSPAAKRIAQLRATRSPDRPAPSAPSPHDDDCAYCPLLGRLAPTVPILAVATPILPAIAPPALPVAASFGQRPPGAPGARGPPLRG
ncbi:MAG: DUF2946 family protein [Xanthomonadales bacterium]|nr:DUF2946 family protein [Xanthomonadales bacterium]